MSYRKTIISGITGREPGNLSFDVKILVNHTGNVLTKFTQFHLSEKKKSKIEDWVKELKNYTSQESGTFSVQVQVSDEITGKILINFEQFISTEKKMLEVNDKIYDLAEELL